MARIGYNMTQAVMDDYAKFKGEDGYTGIMFRYSDRYFLTCTCGNHQESRTHLEVCPQCGGKVVDCCYNKLLRTPYIQERCAIIRKRNTFKIVTLRFRVTYCASSGCYESTVTEEGILTGTFSPLHVTETPSVKTGGSREIWKLFEMPEFKFFDMISSIIRPRSAESVNKIVNLLNSQGITAEDIKHSPFLYGHYIKKYADDSCPHTFKEFLKLDVGLDSDEAIEFAAANNLSYQHYWLGVEKIGEIINYLFSGKMAVSGLICELLSRGVYSLMNVDPIVQMHKSLMNKELKVPVLSGPNAGDSWRTEIIKVDKHLVDDFEWFIKKYSFMSAPIADVFAMRVATLRFLGEPLVQENFIDKRYYGIINSPRIVYKGENFEADFEKNPLEALKKMK